MSNDAEFKSVLEEIRSKYSVCDVSDALINLNVPSAGFLRDILPIPTRVGSKTRVVAPVSTVLHVDKTHQPGQQYPGIIVPDSSNLPSDKHFADLATPGNVVIMQQPSHHTAAVLGDILATRYKLRGVLGFVADARIRDVVRCEELCQQGGFTAWTKSLSCGNSKQAKPWAVDIPLQIGDLLVKPGDIIVADEGEMSSCVIPRGKLDAVMELLPIQKEADDGFYNDVVSGMEIKSALSRWPKHYSISDPVSK